MSCIAPPTLPDPPDISPFSVVIATPPFSGDLTFCCKIAAYAIPPFPLPLGVTVDPTVLAALKAMVAAANAFLRAIPPKCPRS